MPATNTAADETETKRRKLIPGVHENGDVDWPLTFTLRRPIEANGENVKQITLQEPTGDHAMRYGLLTRSLNDENIVELVSSLAAIPPSSVKRMSAADLIKLTTVFGGFFTAAASLEID